METTRRRLVSGLLNGCLGAGTLALLPGIALGNRNPAEEPMAGDLNLPELVLCIPGPWSDHGELVKATIEQSGGYLFAGRILMHIETKLSCEVVQEKADPRMVRAFTAAGPHWKNTPEMSAIAEHRSVVYLVGKGGSRVDAEAMMLAARGLILAGGLGVKVESSGIAHSPKAWLDFTEKLNLFTAHQALVLYVTGPDVYSCGMHNLGLRDAITSVADRSEAVELLRVFTYYLFTESPSIRAGQTFRADASAPVYRIAEDPGVKYELDSLFTNPYGFWRLTAVAHRQASRDLTSQASYPRIASRW